MHVGMQTIACASVNAAPARESPTTITQLFQPPIMPREAIVVGAMIATAVAVCNASFVLISNTLRRSRARRGLGSSTSSGPCRPELVELKRDLPASIDAAVEDILATHPARNISTLSKGEAWVRCKFVQEDRLSEKHGELFRYAAEHMHTNSHVRTSVHTALLRLAGHPMICDVVRTATPRHGNFIAKTGRFDCALTTMNIRSIERTFNTVGPANPLGELKPVDAASLLLAWSDTPDLYKHPVVRRSVIPWLLRKQTPVEESVPVYMLLQRLIHACFILPDCFHDSMMHLRWKYIVS